jgi:hypothetical protein
LRLWAFAPSLWVFTINVRSQPVAGHASNALYVEATRPRHATPFANRLERDIGPRLAQKLNEAGLRPHTVEGFR